ncbi:hypothetical protein [Halioxenophilus aromaticivorans]|uniref:Uncharacterized protein n=1 Tax=Halioxenophilus aromaticivorans TaxID=1306992 RepID=A0AAV3U098_9ALTE
MTSYNDSTSRDLTEWQVWRRDANGNQLMITTLHRETAEQLAADFSQRCYPQHYWCSAAEDDMWLN